MSQIGREGSFRPKAEAWRILQLLEVNPHQEDFCTMSSLTQLHLHTFDLDVLVESSLLLIDIHLLQGEKASIPTTITAFTGSVSHIHALFESACNWCCKDCKSYNVPTAVIRATKSRTTFAIVSQSLVELRFRQPWYSRPCLL
jgi:hypothetical protein